MAVWARALEEDSSRISELLLFNERHGWWLPRLLHKVFGGEVGAKDEEKLSFGGWQPVCFLLRTGRVLLHVNREATVLIFLHAASVAQ